MFCLPFLYVYFSTFSVKFSLNYERPMMMVIYRFRICFFEKREDRCLGRRKHTNAVKSFSPVKTKHNLEGTAVFATRV